MRIRFESSGGFTGMQLATTVDTNKLDPEVARPLVSALEETDFFGLPSDLDTVEGYDQKTYKVTVDVGNYSHTVCFTDATTPEPMAPFVRQMTSLARRSPAAPGHDTDPLR
jgi:hypothetical protein